MSRQARWAAYSGRVFGRKKTVDAPLADASAAHSARPGAKNRPTPKRRQQEAANKRPLVVTDRKAAAQTDKLRRREQMARQRAAMVTGDDAHLPARDKGPERRFIRDYVDARWSVGEFMLPVMLLVLLLSFVRQSWALLVVFAAVYGLIAVAVIDSILMWRRIKSRVAEKYGADRVPAGGAMYAVMRSFQMRRTRMPKPQVTRGQSPG
jgi:hypothetical protein